MAENTSTYTLNLDAEQFTSAANKAAGALTSIGEAGEAVSVLIETLEHIGLALGIVTVAFLALEKTFEAIFDSERIAATENQFKTLSSSAGVYSETLLRGLTEASNGWATQAELMTHANKAMTELEAGVDKLPGLMEAAKKATAVMGGDFLQNFDAMAQSVATGNTRGLRHLGIIIDQQKAYRDYAASIGATVETLSLAGKQEAIMNAVLAQTNDKFKGQGDELKKNINLWQQIKTIFSEIGEALTVLIGKFASPVLSRFFGGLKVAAEDFRNTVVATFGEGTAKVEAMDGQLKSLKENLAYLEKQKSIGIATPEQLADIDKLKAKIAEYETEIEKTKKTDQTYLAQEKQRHTQEMTMASDKEGASRVNSEAEQKRRADSAKAAAASDAQIAALDSKLLADEIKNNADYTKSAALYDKQRAAEAAQTEAKIAEAKAKQEEIIAAAHKAHTGKLYADEEAQVKKLDEQIVRLNKLKNDQMERDDAELARMQKAALDKNVRDSKTATEGIANSFSSMSKKNEMALKDMGQFGTTVTDAFATHSVASIQEWAKGHETAAQAVKGMMFGMISDIAIKQGTLMFMSSVWPPQPPGLIGGAALIAFGAALSGMAGASAGSGGGASLPSTGSMSGGSLTNPASSTSLPTQASSQTQQAASGVHITVQGSIFDTQATQTRIADLVRSAQDSTDFSIAKVGGGV